MRARLVRRASKRVWAIRSPLGVLIAVKSNRTAKAATEAYARRRWPLRWCDLARGGYRVERVALEVLT